MRIVVALGGNALLKRGEAMTFENQQRNVQRAAAAIAPLAERHELIITHGNGPQVGLLALQSEAYAPGGSYPLDLLDAETEGMIGYLVSQELGNLLGDERSCATLLTRIEIDPKDPAFSEPSKPVGPVYAEAEARRLGLEHGWRMVEDGSGWRRAVASPRPRRILEIEIIELLVAEGIIVICAGGGGIPIAAVPGGGLTGIEAVIDKDFASSLLAEELNADALLLLTDVEGVFRQWGKPQARLIRRGTVAELGELPLAPGTMGPKVAAACEFIAKTGSIAGIGSLEDASAILAGQAGTLITANGSS